jgi:hypothetical protein
MMNYLINEIHWPITIAISPIVVTHLTCFQNPLREDIKPIFRGQIEAFIFPSLESEFYPYFNIFVKFLYLFKYHLTSGVKSPIGKTDFDEFIMLSKPFIRYCELLFNFL